MTGRAADITYPGILNLLGRRALDFPDVAELLCRVEAYNKEADRIGIKPAYIRSWDGYQASLTRRHGKKPKPGQVPMMPGIALHKEYE